MKYLNDDNNRWFRKRKKYLFNFGFALFSVVNVIAFWSNLYMYGDLVVIELVGLLFVLQSSD